MSYTLVGHYPNVELLPALTTLALHFDYTVSPSGYGLADGRFQPVEYTFRPYVERIFPAQWKMSMLVALHQGASIEPHEDKDQLPRYHVVLQTNEKSWSYSAPHWQQLTAGGVYLMDPRVTHASINWGAEPRVHLIIDTEGYQCVGL